MYYKAATLGMFQHALRLSFILHHQPLLSSTMTAAADLVVKGFVIPHSLNFCVFLQHGDAASQFAFVRLLPKGRL